MSGIMSAMVQASISAPPVVPTWSATYKGPNITLSVGDLVATIAGGAFETVLGTVALSGTGSFSVITDVVGANYLIGIANTGISLTNFVGGSTGGIGLYVNSNVFSNGGVIGNGPGFSGGDTVTVEYDIPGAQVRFKINGGTASAWFAFSITGPVYPAGSELDNGSKLTGVF